MWKALRLTTGVSVALLVVAALRIVASSWYALERFGADHLVPAVATLAIVRQLAADYTLVTVCLLASAVVQAQKMPPRRVAVASAMSVVLLYPLVLAIVLGVALGACRVFIGPLDAVRTIVRAEDVLRGLIMTAAFAPFAAGWSYILPHVRLGLVGKLGVTWLVMTIFTLVVGAIVSVFAGKIDAIPEIDYPGGGEINASLQSDAGRSTPSRTVRSRASSSSSPPS